MTMHLNVQIQQEDFDVADEIEALTTDEAGAVATFTGLVRGGDGITGLVIEHYPGMTEREIRHIAEQAQARWTLITGITIIHRIGRLSVGERIVLVAVASAHRQSAFAACEFLMDYLKTRAPFWKQEARGEALSWVEHRASDDAAAERWRKP
ncbi:MAG: molybdenum cofactor biosynthesis protein MoaE [Alphaproteobacteria bacterium]|nr:molybdenum cofactor biosynthesis protein MoaE [Alphaproteobacteria bacterium]MBL7097988.1 molybdenum cofactor biosynthesis protein MoaE [Alphaproteobacteria bacterium]